MQLARIDEHESIPVDREGLHVDFEAEGTAPEIDPFEGVMPVMGHKGGEALDGGVVKITAERGGVLGVEDRILICRHSHASYINVTFSIPQYEENSKQKGGQSAAFYG